MGLQKQPQRLRFNNHDVGQDGWIYDSEAKVLRITELDSFTGMGAWNQIWNLAWE
jgi:hypothetical protein